jgi:hypothetical protein
MVDLAAVVLRAMYDQAESEGRHLYVDEAHLGAALRELDGYGDQVHLGAVGSDGHLRVEFR